MNDAADPGWVAPAVRSEFPGLGLASLEVEGPSGRSPGPVQDRLRELSNRFHGGHAIHLRQRPIPWAYRVFFRQIGLDPDRDRTPVEQLAYDRIKSGGFKSRNHLDDALTIAIVETGVAIRAFDAEKLEGLLGIRDSGPGESLEGRPGELPQGTLVIADERRPVGMLFGATAEGRGVHPATTRIILAATRVKGVPEIAIEEALWMAAAVMGVGRPVRG
ncbi:MAG TPA: B3/4 domain-containing protein [Solirubrobacterales bacterium]|nr:B3/4 domain-containing protein [Solirubrobacterales bacterium]